MSFAVDVFISRVIAEMVFVACLLRESGRVHNPPSIARVASTKSKRPSRCARCQLADERVWWLVSVAVLWRGAESCIDSVFSHTEHVSYLI